MSADDRVRYWQRRARDAEWRILSLVREAKHTREWALEAFAEQRRLSERCTFLYGEATRLGATAEQLAQPNLVKR